MRSNPLCEVCDENGCSTLATEVHHVIPCESEASKRGIETLMFNRMNLQALCRSCHSDIHRQMFSQSKESVQANKKRTTERFVDRFLDDDSKL